MSREIKFRAWHLYGGKDMRSPGMIYDDKPGDCLRWKAEGQKITDIMQFTGRRDKNGKEIYEGDKFETTEGSTKIVLVVRFDEMTAMFGFDSYENKIAIKNYCEFEPMCSYHVKNMEITGNIHTK